MTTSSVNDCTVRSDKSQQKQRRHVGKRNKKPQAYPSNESQWAYWMQAIEPADRALNEAFPGYHPLWVQQSQRLAVSGEQFKYFRQQLLSITQKQCAAYLRVKIRTVQAWEQGREPVPFMAFELLRLVYEGATFKLSHPAWDGWFVEKSGRLVSPDRGKLSFAPFELSYVRETYSSKANLEADNAQLRAEVEALKQEAEYLREFISSDGLLNELQSMKKQLESMLENIGSTTAKVYQFPSLNQARKAATA